MKVHFKAITVALLVIVAVVYSICFFVVPFGIEQNQVGFFITYGVTLFLIGIVGIVALVAFNKSSLKMSTIGLAVLKSAVIALIIQFFANVAFYALGSYFIIQTWVTLVVESCLIGVDAVILIAMISYRRYIAQNEKKQSEVTSFIFELRRRYTVLCNVCQPRIKAKMVKLYELILYTNPVSTPDVLSIEKSISLRTQELSNRIEAGDVENADKLIDELIGLVNKRKNYLV